MKNKIAYTANIKYHFLIGLFLGIWLYLFLVVIGPFDVFPLNIKWRAQVMSVYGLSFMFSYWAIIPLQNQLYRKNGRWNLQLELFIILFFLTINFAPTIIYYKSEIIRGDYPFWNFVFQIYIPTCLILIPIVFGIRMYISNYVQNIKKQRAKLTEKIIISGDNRLDALQINPNDLIFIKSANNYVEVNYLKNNQPDKKLLRTTTKKILREIPDVIQVHRSYLINPAHFIEWRNSKKIALTYLEVPVSEKYKKQLQMQLATHP